MSGVTTNNDLINEEERKGQKELQVMVEALLQMKSMNDSSF